MSVCLNVYAQKRERERERKEEIHLMSMLKGERIKLLMQVF